MSDLNLTLQAALRAVDEGRVPAEEVILARLKRKGLITRNVFERGWHVTAASREELEAA